MELCGKRVGFALTGSHCTIPEVLPQIENLVRQGADVVPIISSSVANVNSRFCKAADIIRKLEEITGKEPMCTITETEQLGPVAPLDILVIAPCTGNTLAKLANAITDGPVLMAAKAHLRNGRPLVIGISTNDAFGLNARNLGVLLTTKNVYFVPFGQDNPTAKPSSLIADMSLIPETVKSALDGKQLQPILIDRRK
ncbi:MAG TPA: dipicolinate synthase subunit B [Firmicutes bacterium]|nr:dipicolinate synthase subunit B [Bacillota bacterium]